MTVCHLIVDQPAAGGWNMAVDEQLLLAAAELGEPTLRFYQWSQPTVSLGYFQKWADRATHPASRECPCVRRHTGGGAIVHDQELTYSLTLPLENRWSQSAGRLYDDVHQSLIQCLNSYATPATNVAFQQSDGSGNPTAVPYLCFQRRANGDVVETNSNTKIVGSAQSRRQRALLQHGSILLAQSPQAPELPGLLETLARSVLPSIPQLIEDICEQLSARFDWEFRTYPPESRPHDTIEQILQQKFENAGWNQRR